MGTLSRETAYLINDIHNAQVREFVYDLNKLAIGEKVDLKTWGSINSVLDRTTKYKNVDRTILATFLIDHRPDLLTDRQLCVIVSKKLYGIPDYREKKCNDPFYD